jgi:hypothetical protein
VELKCSCHTAHKFEGLATALVDKKIAKVVKYDDKKSAKGVVEKCVKEYEIAIGDWGETTVIVRWWYDLLNDRASIQMSHEALDALLDSVTVMCLMMELGQKVNKNGHGVNSDDLKAVLKKAIKQLAGKEEEIEVVL